MLRASLSAVDWAGIWSKINQFFQDLFATELEFYLFIGGCALIFIALLSFILAASYKHRAKKAAKAGKGKKGKKDNKPAKKEAEQKAPAAAPVKAPAAAPAPAPYSAPVAPTPEYRAPAPAPAPFVVAEPAVSESFSYSVPEPTPAPVYEEPVTPDRVVDEEAPAFTTAPSTSDNEFSFLDEPEDEPAPVEETPEEIYVEETPVEEEPEELPEEEPAPVPADDDSGWAKAKIAVKPAKKAPAKKAPVEEVPEEVEEAPAPVKKAPAKKAPAAKAAPAKKEAAPKAAPAKKEPAKPAPAPEKPKVVGKYVIENNGYSFQFCLFANNGQLLYESREYASAASCKSGIETFKKNVQGCDYRVDVDKNGGFKYIFKKGNSLYIGETYSTQKAAERSAESVKRFANISELSE